MLKINYDLVKEYYQAGIWTAEDVKKAYLYGYITAQESDEILNNC